MSRTFAPTNPPSDKLFDEQYIFNAGNPGHINIGNVWDDYTGGGVDVVVFDEGIDFSHEDLANQISNRHFDSTTQTEGQPPLRDGVEKSGFLQDDHGTRVASIIGADNNANQFGMVGVAFDCDLHSIYQRFGNNSFSAFDESIEFGFNVASQFDVINNSWSFDSAFADNFTSNLPLAGDALSGLAGNGRDHLGTVIVFSAGNSRAADNDVNLHAFQNSRYSITTAATNAFGNSAVVGAGVEFSTRGSAILVSAPGEDVTAAMRKTPVAPDFKHFDFDGTSFSAPIVSGVAALMLEANPSLGWRDVQEIFAYTARQNDADRKEPDGKTDSWAFNGARNWNGGGLHVSHDFGYGLIDAHGAVRLAESWDAPARTSLNETQLSSAALIGGALQMPENGSSTEIIFSISAAQAAAMAYVEHAELRLGFTHTRVNDLIVQLISPDGTRSLILDTPSKGGSNIVAGAGFEFNFQTVMNWGESPVGDWRLIVTDTRVGEKGAITSAELNLFGTATTADDIYVFTDEFGGLVGKDTSRAIIEDKDGGIDTLNLTAVTDDVVVDLKAGKAQIGTGNASIVAGTVIERVFTGDGNDKLIGSDGSDVLAGGRGNDTIDGGAGIDTLNLSFIPHAHDVNLSTGIVIDIEDPAGSLDLDIVTNIENVIGSDRSDKMTGSADANRLDGGIGDDKISGGGGADTLVGGLGDDTLDGNDGIDTIDLSGGTHGLEIDLSAGTIVDLEGVSIASEKDTVINVENVIGTNQADKISGNASANQLDGAGGNDTLSGGAGDDTLLGGAGIDTVTFENVNSAVSVDLGGGVAVSADGTDQVAGVEIVLGSKFSDSLSGDSGNNSFVGGDGDDTLVGGLGDDKLDGGKGFDTVDYGGSTGSVSVDLGAGIGDGADGKDLLTGIEGVLGSGFDDSLTGDDGDNALAGAAGNDTIQGGAGDDAIDGGAGTDTVDFAGLTDSVTLDLSSGTAISVDGTDSISNVENATGSDFADSLTGDAGNNLFAGGKGDDQIQGGAGSDTTSYAGADGAVTVDLSAGTVDGADGKDVLSGIENAIGSAFDDVFKGDAGNNRFDGGDGVDTADYSDLTGGLVIRVVDGVTEVDATAGGGGIDSLISVETLIGTNFVDTITGSDGDDTFAAGKGDDLFDGGAGSDTISFELANGAVTVDLTAGSAISIDGTTSLVDIENVIGSAFDDNIAGNAEDNRIAGGLGDDTMDGGAGRDTLEYGGAAAGVTIDLATGKASGGAGNDQVNNFENIAGSTHNDSLTGDASDNVILGGAGNDTVSAGAGNDTVAGGRGADKLDGGKGIDSVAYDDAIAGVTIDLADNSVVGPDGNGTLAGFESIGGSAFDDRVIVSETIGERDASMATLIGGSGNDTIDFSKITTGVTASLGDSNIDLSGAQYELVGFERLVGSQFADSLGGDAASNTLSGGAGNDTVNGADGADVIDGEVGNDRLLGGGEGDTLRGGDGADTLVGGDGDDLLEGGVSIGNDSDTADFRGGGAVSVSLRAGTSAGQGTDQLRDIENIIGSGFDDLLEGDGRSNILNGEEGFDLIDFSKAKVDAGTKDTVFANLGGGFADGTDGIDLLQGIEAVRGSSGRDSLVGDGKGNLLDGGAGNDQLFGVSGNDTLRGGAGNDKLDGGIGDDLLQDNTGADTFDGGAGFDTVSFENSTAAVVAKLGAGTIEQAGFTDKILNVEKVVGGTSNDTLNAGATAITFDGGAGDDSLTGGSGNDVLIGGAGNDKIDGGAGNDTVVFGGKADVTITIGSSGAVTVTGSDEGTDTFLNIENISGGSGNDTIKGNDKANQMAGGDGNDTLLGGGGNDTLIGSAGDDVIDGGVGTDTLILAVEDGTGLVIDLTGAGTEIVVDTGSLGKDKLKGVEAVEAGNGDDRLTSDVNGHRMIGGGGADTLNGGGGKDTLDGGDGIDTLELTFVDKLTSRTINLGAKTMTVGAASAVTGFEIVDARGNIKDVITGSAGNDTLLAGGGDDLIIGGLGDDRMDGGDGVDTVSYATLLGGITADLFAGTVSSTEGLDTITGIEGVIGSKGNDTIVVGAQFGTVAGTIDAAGGASDTLDLSHATLGLRIDLANTSNQLKTDIPGAVLKGFENVIGSEAADSLKGSAVANRVEGGAGDDTIDGGAGNDILIGGAGVDNIDGGKDSDTVVFDDPFGVTVTLNNDKEVTAIGGLGEDRLKNVEHLTGGAGNDVFGGDGNANALSGGGGNDTLAGDAGNDTLIGGIGDDIMTGGVGNDTVTYGDATSGILIDLNNGAASGGAGQDKLSGVEVVVGSNADDKFILDVGQAFLSGITTIKGGAGFDSLIVTGSAALINGILTWTDTAGLKHTINVSEFEDIFIDTKNNTNAQIPDKNGGISQTGSGDDTIKGSAGADKITAGAGNDSITGGAGNDTIDGGAGKDTIDGGAGIDLVSFAAAQGAVSFDGLKNTVTENGVTETIKLVEIIVGSNFADTLVGGTSSDTFVGGLGDDSMNGGAGTSDAVSFISAFTGVDLTITKGVETTAIGDGTDKVINFENIIGSAHDDRFTGDLQANVLEGNDGNDVLDGSFGADKLLGGAGNDLLKGGDGNDADVLDGGAGNDTLLGGGGNDVSMVGGDGDDLIDGGLGADKLFGGTGNDLLKGGDGNDADVLDGGVGNDTLLGGGGNDVSMVGGDGDDLIDGGLGADKLFGGAGNDLLSGGDGIDELTGGAGADVFLYLKLDEANDATATKAGDVIKDFVHGVDKVDISALFEAGEISFNELRISAGTKDTFVFFDKDADGKHDGGEFSLTFTATTAIDVSDFVFN
jgi:Ca2+-binding RTX toxin-like protein